MEGHELYRRWVGLCDSTGKFDGIQGYLRLSLTILGPGDVAPAHDVEEEVRIVWEGSNQRVTRMMTPQICSRWSCCLPRLSPNDILST